MKIRPAHRDDALPMARVFVNTFIDTYHGVMSEEWLQKRRQEWRYELFADDWQKLIDKIAAGNAPRSLIYVAEDTGGEVVGFALTRPSKSETVGDDVAELDLLYINTNRQRQGIGRALVLATAAHLVELGVSTLQILTPVDHAQGRAFYDKLGGRIVGAREDYDDGDRIELVIYEWNDLPALASEQDRGVAR